MKPSIIVSSSDLERLEGLLTLPAFRSRSDLDGLRAELERADVREPQDMPADVITMNSRARFVEEGTGREYELTLAYPKDANAEALSSDDITVAPSRDRKSTRLNSSHGL